MLCLSNMLVIWCALMLMFWKVRGIVFPKTTEARCVAVGPTLKMLSMDLLTGRKFQDARKCVLMATSFVLKALPTMMKKCRRYRYHSWLAVLYP